MNIRVMPPASGATTTVNGRSYTAAAGATLDVPDFDAWVLSHNGWTVVATGGAGATTARPAAPVRGMVFHDTTLGYNVLYDGKSWRNPATGASV